MGYHKNVCGLSRRPSSSWNKDFVGPLKPIISPIHEHEFGEGRDIQYKDKSGKVQARLDGLTIEEAAYLRYIKNIGG